jgi:hypothetical protein
MQKLRFRILAAVVIVQALVIFHLWMSKELVVLSEASADQKYLAQISSSREFPYLTLVTYLTVKEIAHQHVVQRHLLFGADTIEDIVLEIYSLKWQNDSVEIDSKGSRYTGSRVFNIQTSSS